jgi:GH24 family phage-related lysozyme (muramidase)
MSDLSPAAMKLLLDYEVGGGEAYYNSQLRHPTWPGGESGVTIGIGYDLGYTPRARFFGDWHALEDDVRDRLAATIGVKGDRARQRAREVRDITIPWAMAYEVFQRSTIPFWVAQTQAAFPGLDALPWDASGALVSLVFNRGPSMVGERRSEMRAIRELVPVGKLPMIAKNLREMKRLWRGKGLSGLLTRREAEAKLVEGSK